MPWKETDVQKDRVKFVLEWERRWDAGERLVNAPKFPVPAVSTIADVTGPSAT